MLGYPRLGDAELLLDDRTDLAGRPFAVREELEDAASYGITEDVEGVHDSNNNSRNLYKSRLMLSYWTSSRSMTKTSVSLGAMSPWPCGPYASSDGMIS